MYSVTIDAILILNCAFEPEDYLRGELGYKKKFVNDTQVKVVLAILENSSVVLLCP